MREPVLKYECVDVSYGGTVAVRQVTAEVHAGETLCIVGESGSGKSTLIKAAMGLLGSQGEVSNGRIFFEGSDLMSLPNDDLRVHCGPDMAMVFQDSLASLTPIRTIGDQLFEAVHIHQDIPRKGVEEKACDLLARMNIDDPCRVLESYPFELSGGMGQRVGIMMALIMEPKVLFADEPTSALDAFSQKLVVQELVRLQKDVHNAIVLVTHNIGVARYMADKVLVLKDGSVVEQGRASEVLAHPQRSYTRELLDAVPALSREEG